MSGEIQIVNAIEALARTAWQTDVMLFYSMLSGHADALWSGAKLLYARSNLLCPSVSKALEKSMTMNTIREGSVC